MKLTFKNDQLRRMLEQAETCWKRGTRNIWADEGPVQTGFWLVGDLGVYLMHNGIYDNAANEMPVVAHAIECDPNTDGDSFHKNKLRSFGGDDGTEFLEREFIETAIRRGDDLHIFLTPRTMDIRVAAVSSECHGAPVM